ncbi:IS256 family transposase [Flavihumibacter profundi]|uniref:IS256 family transposase n=1 Tax=Flavihumibacter profundi TaxID=2716883 RepID=UPI001CC38DE2|nr:IS256 family transposase [Flavihumibacter profundi]MBZ5859622.1 IS256 family transposase [Flavihumibacter profundi]
MLDKQHPDYERLQKKALEQLRTGKSLFGKGGAFAPLLKQFIEAALEAELDEHLDDEQRDNGNRKNGKTSKRLKTAEGTLDIETPRDRDASFEPQLVKKRETILAESLEQKILGLYGYGMSFRDIAAHIKEMYDTEISATTLSAITDKIIPLVTEWQNRMLDATYCIVFLDAMYYKVKDEGRIITRCVYNILGITVEGRKELLGMYISESEGANFWLSVLSHLQQRGVKDILIACIDNLKGFAEAIASIFPRTEVQTCVVHQIRNSLKYIASKDQKAFMAELKPVYKAVSLEQAEQQFQALEAKWGKKYPLVIDSWHRNWSKLTTYFKYPQGIRKMIYTTNIIEGFHRQIRKVTKTKGAFTSDMSLLKLIYLATMNIQKSWTRPLLNWTLTISQLSIIFGDRMKLKI